MIRNNRKKRLLCLILAVLLCAASLTLTGFAASAAGTPTSLGLAQHGIDAHRDGWLYISGNKGQLYNGVRSSDCAGLLYAYFSDVGALGDCRGGATSQVTYNCVFSNDITEGIPNIHGLALTMPDYYSPQTGVYGHIGIYIGNNEAADNSDSNYNMRREPVVGSGRNWSAWHVFDNGMKYPVSGWYELDGKMVHYTNYEYDTDTVIDGYVINEEGYAEMPGGSLYPVDRSLLSDKWASASQVAAYLSGKYSGRDSTYELAYGGSAPDPVEGESNYNGKITGDGVNLRQSATTKSNVITVLSRGSFLDVLGEEKGEAVSHGGKSSDTWYSVATPGGQTGYVCSLFVEKIAVAAPAAPVITAAEGYVTMTSAASQADIYYTTDGATPTKDSTPYVGPLFLTGHTFKAIAVQGSGTSAVTTATVLSNSTVFTDLNAKAWYFNSVDEAVNALIFRGNGDGTFSPDKAITRGQFVTALANLDRVDLDEYVPSSSFDDVKAGSSRTAQAILWAADLGIVHGYDEKTFGPNDVISREQMCVILANYAGLDSEKEPAAFADNGKISSWAKNAVYACRDNGLVNGIGGNQFDPQGTATRAQACKIMVNLYHMA